MHSLKRGSLFPRASITARACIEPGLDGLRTSTFLDKVKGFHWEFPVRSNLRDELGLKWVLQQECDNYMIQLRNNGGPNLTESEANALVDAWYEALIEIRKPNVSLILA